MNVPDHSVEVVGGELELRDGEESHEVAWVMVTLSIMTGQYSTAQ